MHRPICYDSPVLNLTEHSAGRYFLRQRAPQQGCWATWDRSVKGNLHIVRLCSTFNQESANTNKVIFLSWNMLGNGKKSQFLQKALAPLARPIPTSSSHNLTLRSYTHCSLCPALTSWGPRSSTYLLDVFVILLNLSRWHTSFFFFFKLTK